MKPQKIIILLAVFLLSQQSFGQHYLQLKNQSDLYEFFRWSEDRLPLVSAHRGGPEKGFPENCIETFEHTLEQGHAILECDIQLTKDSILVMMHDDLLERTSTGKGKLSDFTKQALDSLFLEDNQGNLTSFRIPTLDQVLQWARNKTILMLDVKKGVPFEMIVEAISRNEAENWVCVITYNSSDSKKVYQLNPVLVQSVSINEVEVLEKDYLPYLPSQNMVAFTGVGKIKTDLYQKLHKQQIMAIVGCMKTFDQQALEDKGQIFEEIFQVGGDIFATDETTLCNDVLEHYQMKPSSKSHYFFKIK
jgi:glycerophosphoryl diester phosphodiesterase